MTDGHADPTDSCREVTRRKQKKNVVRMGCARLGEEEVVVVAGRDVSVKAKWMGRLVCPALLPNQSRTDGVWAKYLNEKETEKARLCGRDRYPRP